MAVRSGNWIKLPGLKTVETVACNQCDGTATRLITGWDRYGLPVKTVACVACGLRFINPRMTAKAYEQFYKHDYRALLTHHLGYTYTTAMVQENMRKYAISLIREVSKVVEPYPDSTLVDLGGSTGEVARAFANKYGCKTTVVDPSAEELAYASGETICAPAESVDFPDASLDVILLCRTIEHLLNPKGVLTRARRWATDRAFLVVDAMDVLEWPPHSRYKIDHPYSFTVDTLWRMVESAGWRVRGTWNRRGTEYVGLVCSPL